MRTIKVISTTGKTLTINAEFETFGELKSYLISEGFSFDNTKAITSEKVTLEHDMAVLPNLDFNLYLMPVKTKSGANSLFTYSELRNKIDELIENHPTAIIHFGENYKLKSTSSLEALLDSYVIPININQTNTSTSTFEETYDLHDILSKFEDFCEDEDLDYSRGDFLIYFGKLEETRKEESKELIELRKLASDFGVNCENC